MELAGVDWRVAGCGDSGQKIVAARRQCRRTRAQYIFYLLASWPSSENAVARRGGRVAVRLRRGASKPNESLARENFRYWYSYYGGGKWRRRWQMNKRCRSHVANIKAKNREISS